MRIRIRLGSMDSFDLWNFIVALIFERLIIPAFSAIWDMRKLDKLRLRKLNESENNLTMQELFKLTEKE